MKPAPFSYHRARSAEEAVSLLAELGDDAKLLAGGQSLVAMMNFRLARPAALVDISRLAELRYVRVHDGELRIGALALHRDLERLADPGVLARVRDAPAGGAVYRPLRHPGRGHVRRQHRPRRSCRRVVHGRVAVRRPDRGASAPAATG